MGSDGGQDQKEECLLSLCIPTNGITEWVEPVLKSIYDQNVPESLFEVVVADNGTSSDFEACMWKWEKAHKNLIYSRTTAERFLNQIVCFRMAGGTFLKFVNHRSVLERGSIEYLLTFAREYREARPVVFFANGNLGLPERKQLPEFDQFVRELSYWSSWSGGLACWRADVCSLSEDMSSYNALFPHITILFSQRCRDSYVIDDRRLFRDQPCDNRKKGHYNLFYAFGVEYVSVLLDLLRKGAITAETFLQVRERNQELLRNLYLSFVIRKEPCSYDLTDCESYLNVFYDARKIRAMALRYRVKEKWAIMTGKNGQT